MNCFTAHMYGHYADDGFGNLVRLPAMQIACALHNVLSDTSFYGDTDEVDTQAR